MQFNSLLFVLLASASVSALAKGPAAQSEAQIKAALIRQSIASYSGHCPCPYNTASNGSSCGRRSAYSRPGGYAPLCYPEDVSPAMVAEYRATSR